MVKLMRIALSFMAVFLLAAILIPAGSLIIGYSLGYRYSITAGRSMEPTINSGGLVVLKPVESQDQIKVGDIITFIAMEGPGTTFVLFDPETSGEPFSVIHRVAVIKQDGGQIFIKTKGDHNPDLDQFWIPKDKVLARLVLYIPKGKYYISWILALSD